MTDDSSAERVETQSFEDLEVFKRAYRLSLAIHRKSLEFPQLEQYALADQVRRASKSIPANLAEGWAKWHRSSGEFRRYVLMAIGSADEMRVWLRYCLDLGYIDEPLWKEWRDEFQIIARMLHALAKTAAV